MTILQLNSITWTIWYATWLAAVVFSARTTVQNGADVRSVGRIYLAIGLLLVITPRSLWLDLFSRYVPALTFLARPFWSLPESLNWTGFGLVIAGFAFCWWARLHLGRLWSGFTTLKEGHMIVDTGPYGIVRHPIYAGIIFSGLMTAALNANLIGAVGFLCLTVGVTIIARLEELFLRQQLGDAAYGAYAARVPMLVPGWIR